MSFFSEHTFSELSLFRFPFSESFFTELSVSRIVLFQFGPFQTCPFQTVPFPELSISIFFLLRCVSFQIPFHTTRYDFQLFTVRIFRVSFSNLAFFKVVLVGVVIPEILLFISYPFQFSSS